MHENPTNAFIENIRENTSDLRNKLHRLGAFVGWLPIRIGDNIEERDSREFRDRYLAKWSDIVDSKTAFFFSDWSSEWLVDEMVSSSVAVVWPSSR